MSGLISQFIVAPDVMQKRQKVPQAMYDQCKAQGIASAGNAAGFFDTDTFTGLTPSPTKVLN